jgi:outer membrane immunogenic protein
MTRTELWKGVFLIAAPAALALASLALASPAGAQQSGGEGSRVPPIDITATYTAEHAKISPSGDCGCFWLQGGSGEANIYVYRGLSVAAELTGSRVGNVTPGVDISQIAVMGGPRYTFGTSRWTDRFFGSQHRTSFFGEALFGGVHAFDGAYPSSTGLKTTASAFSMQVGGGFNIRLAKNFGLRAFEVDYVRTSLPNGTTDSQHDLRLAAGISYQIHR